MLDCPVLGFCGLVGLLYCCFPGFCAAAHCSCQLKILGQLRQAVTLNDLVGALMTDSMSCNFHSGFSSVFAVFDLLSRIDDISPGRRFSPLDPGVAHLITKCCTGFCLVFVSPRQRSLSRPVTCWLGAKLTAQGAFRSSHHFQAGLPVSSGVGSVHALHVLLFRSHKPFAVGRSIGPIRMARRSCNYSSARGVGRVGVQRWVHAKEPD